MGPSPPSSAAALQSLYLQTEVSIALPGAGWVTAAEAVEMLPTPIFVLTAWNAGPERPGLTRNRERNRRLHERLVELGARVFPAIGASPDGDHYEESYAATGLDRADALALGREFDQVAVFELTPSRQTVVGCEAQWNLSRSLPKLGETLEAPP